MSRAVRFPRAGRLMHRISDVTRLGIDDWTVDYAISLAGTRADPRLLNEACA